ncbi:hypothetical protein [Saccharopolyspora halophila]|uniref:hypothetical protein n=1 Tax=Saccharopolyspora halophila TaxID=405551 RepID=UPI0031DBC54B
MAAVLLLAGLVLVVTGLVLAPVPEVRSSRRAAMAPDASARIAPESAGIPLSR